MSNRKDAIQKHTADMLAVESHVLEAIERQREHDEVKLHTAANELLIRVERTLRTHKTALEALGSDADFDLEASVKKAITNALGAIAGLYDRMREHTLSRMLRDDYTALSLVAMGYTAYHTFGLAIGEQRIATLAHSHLKDITPLLIDISELLPVVVAKEVAEESDFTVDATVASQAVQNTQDAWKPEVTDVA